MGIATQKVQGTPGLFLHLRGKLGFFLDLCWIFLRVGGNAAPHLLRWRAFSILDLRWNPHEGLEAGFNAILERHGLKTKDLAQALRVALCGRPVSPGIFDTLMLVGRDEVVARLERWL